MMMMMMNVGVLRQTSH